MSQSASGNSGSKGTEFDRIVERCYKTYFAGKKELPSSAEFYRAVSETVEEINKKLGSPQFNVPKTTTLQIAFNNHIKGMGEATDQATGEATDQATDGILSKEKFEAILQEVVVETGFTAGFAAKDILAYIFGIPMAAWVFKQRFGPKTIPNDLFIPAITSATVFVLAKLRKI